MAMLHDPQYRADIVRRLETLRPDTAGRWGKMSASQMLWHVNESIEWALGRITGTPERPPLPRALMKFIVINLPWPKGSPTLKSWTPQSHGYDFAFEQARCVRLVEEIASKPIDEAWPDSPTLGRMCGRDVSRLMAKHLNHHLTQFGV